MLFDMRGVDFMRLQSGAGKDRIGDILSPGINFTGAADDGQCIFLEKAVSNPGLPNRGYYSFDLGGQYTAPPLVLGNLRLTQDCVQKGTVLFTAGEIITPCMGIQRIYEQGVVRDYEFSFSVTPKAINFTISGFVGVAQFLVMEI